MTRNWSAIFAALYPDAPAWIVAGMGDAMPKAIALANLSTDARLAAFIGQCGEESDHFRTMREYASGGAYEGRLDLGNVQPGDGARFKGRGAIELTGRMNYRAASVALGVDLEADPALAERFPEAALIAAWFWKRNGCNAYVDRNDDRGLTRAINGGLNGYAMRVALTRAAAQVLAAYPEGAGAADVQAKADAAKRASGAAATQGAGAAVAVGGGATAAHVTSGGLPGWMQALILLAILTIGAVAFWRAQTQAARADMLARLAKVL